MINEDICRFFFNEFVSIAVFQFFVCILTKLRYSLLIKFIEIKFDLY